MSRARLAIIVALPQELAAVEAAIPAGERRGVRLVRGGEGAEATARSVRELLSAPEPPELICSTGLCGGLAAGVAVGDVVLANAILGANDGERYGVEFDNPGLDALRLALTEARVAHHVGAIVSVSAAVTQREAKRQLGAARKALAVDMESWAIASAVRPLTLPSPHGGEGEQAAVFALRVVSDAVEDELPAEVGTFLDKTGRVRVLSVARFVLSSPGNTRKLLALKAHLDRATERLTAAWQAVWRTLSTEY